MFKILEKNARKNSEILVIIILLCLLLIKSTQASARSFIVNADTVVHKTDSVAKPGKSSLLLIGATFGNNSSYLGRAQSSKLPYISTDVTYRHKSGLWISTMAYDIHNSSSFIDEIDLLGGWNFDLSKKVDGSIYYSRYFFSPESELIKASVANALNGFMGVDYNILYSRLTLSHIFGETKDFFLIMDHSRYFEFEKVFHKSDYFSIEPKVSLISGTQSFVETHIGKTTSPISSPVSPSKGPGKPSGTTSGTTTTEETVVKKFDILAYEVSLPLTYSFKNLSLEVSGRFSIPVNLSEGDSSTPQLFITTSLMYAIF